MKISEQEKQVLDSLETSVEVGVAIREIGRCARIGSPRFLSIWDEPTPNQIIEIRKYAVKMALENGEKIIHWGQNWIETANGL
jgi:hypothetical protein